MRFQLMLLTMLFSFTAFGSEDNEIKELFKTYDEVMSGKKAEKIDEIFTKKFLDGSGGRANFVTKVKQLKPDPKAVKQTVTWKKGRRGNIFYAKLDKKSGTQFIVIKENGKLKIDGTIGDDE
jgi:hypothetical protein